MKINLNDEIKVKLTEHGKHIINSYYTDAFKEVNEKYNAHLQVPFEIEMDEEGYSEFQLHEFMHIFGPYVYVGAPGEVIEPLDIIIVERGSEE